MQDLHGSIGLIYKKDSLLTEYIYRVGLWIRRILKKPNITVKELKWSHCFWFYNDYHIFHATIPKVSFSSKLRKKYTQKSNKYVIEIYKPKIVAESEIDTMFKILIDNTVNKWYGLLNILVHPFHSMYMWIKHRQKITKSQYTRGIMCSELIAMGVKIINQDYHIEWRHVVPNNTSPLDLWYMFQDKRLFEKVNI